MKKIVWIVVLSNVMSLQRILPNYCAQSLSSVRRGIASHGPAIKACGKSYIPLTRENKIEKLFERMNVYLNCSGFPAQEDIVEFKKLVELSNYNPVNRYVFDIRKDGEYSFLAKLIVGFYENYDESDRQERELMVQSIKTFYDLGARLQDKEYKELDGFMYQRPRLFKMLKEMGVVDVKKEDTQVKE